VLFLVFTGAIWQAVGSTLRPIGLLRRGAAEVTATGVVADLPVPEARDEVRRLALTLNDMLSRLAAAQQRQRSLVSDTAHELRSPIASIRAQLEVALDHPSGQDWAQTARDVLTDTLRLSCLAEDLLLLARLDEQAGNARPDRTVDLADLAHTVVGRYAAARVPVTVTPAQEAVTQETVTQEISVAAVSTCSVAGNRDPLDRMLVNLIDNAVRYAKATVAVSVGRTGGWVELTVTDDGTGIPQADRERAFDRFARLDDARNRDGEDAGGAGLGLAIVRATAQAYGGTARLEATEPSPGLLAVVRLPAAVAESARA
jgi:signal transduction histidine kinase